MKKKNVPFIDNRPIALYNTDKQELIGIFAKLIYICKYVRRENTQRSYTMLHDSLEHKRVTRKTIFDFGITMRFANTEQIAELGDKKVVIRKGYPIADKYLLQGWEGF